MLTDSGKSSKLAVIKLTAFNFVQITCQQNSNWDQKLLEWSLSPSDWRFAYYVHIHLQPLQENSASIRSYSGMAWPKCKRLMLFDGFACSWGTQTSNSLAVASHGMLERKLLIPMHHHWMSMLGFLGVYCFFPFLMQMDRSPFCKPKVDPFIADFFNLRNFEQDLLNRPTPAYATIA